MALSAKKKLDVLSKAVALRTIFQTECSSDTGQWRGSDTGSSARTSRDKRKARSNPQREHHLQRRGMVHPNQSHSG
jgi:hypothetical protein